MKKTKAKEINDLVFTSQAGHLARDYDHARMVPLQEGDTVCEMKYIDLDSKIKVRDKETGEVKETPRYPLYSDDTNFIVYNLHPDSASENDPNLFADVKERKRLRSIEGTVVDLSRKSLVGVQFQRKNNETGESELYIKYIPDSRVYFIKRLGSEDPTGNMEYDEQTFYNSEDTDSYDQVNNNTPQNSNTPYYRLEKYKDPKLPWGPTLPPSVQKPRHIPGTGMSDAEIKALPPSTKSV